MKQSLLLIIAGIIIGMFLNAQFMSGCNGGCPPCPKLTGIASVTTNTRTEKIDTNITVTAKELISEGIVTVGKQDFKIKKKKKSLVAAELFEYHKTIEDTNKTGTLIGELIITTKGQTLEGLRLDWKHISVVEEVVNNITKTIKDSSDTQTVKDYVVPENKFMLFAGTSIGFGQGRIKDINFNVSAKFKSDRIAYYEMGQDFVMPDSKITHRIGVKLPIRLRKK